MCSSDLIVPLPAPLLRAGAGLAAAMGIATPFSAAEIRRSTEDKSFDISALEQRLGVTPRSFEEGLRLKIERGWVA